MPISDRARSLTLHLHGAARVAAADGRVTLLERRGAALLALAALAPGFGREQAALWLWPDSSDPRRNLRQQLLRFKQQFGAPLLAEGQTLRLAVGVVLADAGAGGLLLAGHPDEGGDSDPGFAAWLRARREECAAVAAAQARDAIADAEAAGRLDAALAAAVRWAETDPTSEVVRREIMRLHYLRGDAGAGMAAFKQLQQMLAEAHGTRPSAETEELAAALQRATQTPRASQLPVAKLPVTLNRPPLMAGRESERDAVTLAWAQGQAVLVEGEAGLGKSRLLAELAATRATSGVVLTGGGRPGDAGAPYASLARLLRTLRDLGSDATALRSDEARAALEHVLVPAAGGGPADTPLRPGLLSAAVTALLEQARVGLVVFDDLHFADEATLDLLAAVVASDTTRHWLLATRPAEKAATTQAWRGSLTELRRLTVVTLAPLDVSATARLLEALAISGLEAATLAPDLVRHTGGNPLYMLETLKQGLSDGSLARGDLPRPAGVGALIDHRLRLLSQPALTLARVAAIAGVDFSIELAEAAIGQSAVQLASAWQELQEAQVLRDEAFAHDLVSDAVLRSVPPVVARRVHAQCAAWLAAHDGAPARVARHWECGGHPREAARAYGQAAQQALRASRRHEESALWQAAAAQWQLAGDAAQRFEALAARVSALVAAALDTQAVDEARALAALATDSTQRMRAARVQLDLLAQAGRVAEALDAAQPGLALGRWLGADAGTAARDEYTRLASAYAGTLLKVGRHEEAYSVLLPLREAANASADPEVRAIWIGYWAATLGHIGRLRESVAAYEDCIALHEAIGRRDAVGAAVLNLGVVQRTLGRLSQALACSRRGVALMDNDPAQATQFVLARLMHARDQAESGQFAQALAAFDELLPLLEPMGGVFWPCALRTAQATAWLHLGQQARALQALQADRDDDTPHWMRSGRRLLRMEIAEAFGQPLPHGAVGEAIELVQGDPYRIAGSAVRALRAASPASVLEQASRWADNARGHERFGLLAALRVHEARAALRLGQVERAAQAAREAMALTADGYVPEAMYAPELHLVAWQALAAAGRTGEARAAVEAGAAWIRGEALPHVPPPYLDSFLHRNAVNRDLLAAAR